MIYYKPKNIAKLYFYKVKGVISLEGVENGHGWTQTFTVERLYGKIKNYTIVEK